MIVVNSSTRQFSIPGADLVFGVTADSGSEIKYFQCPRCVGNNLDLAGSFVRMNYRNANGQTDSYLVEDLAVDGDNVTFSWELSPKVTAYKGNVSFVMCVVGPDTKVKWHTTLGRGQVLEGLEPDSAIVEEGTADVVAALIAMVEAQTEVVEAEGSKQIKAVQSAAKTAEIDAVAEIEAKGVNVRESIPDDYTALSEAVDSAVRGRAGAIVCSAEGSAVAVNDASDNYLQDLRIFGRSTQDGSPTPDAPVEIKSVVDPVVTVCGKNLFKTRFEPGYTETVRGVTFAVNPDRSIRVAGTPTAAIAYNIFEGEVFPVGNYFVSGAPSTASQKFRLQVNLTVGGAEKTGGVDMGEGSKFSVDSSVSSLRGYIYVASDAGAVDGVFYPQIEFGSVATTYEPYYCRSVELTHTLPGIPVTSGGNYTDSDGQQWISDEVDLERGVYVKRTNRYTVNGGDIETWKISSLQSVEGATRFDMYIVGLRAGQQVCLCSHYPGQEKANKYPETCWCNSTGNASYFEFRIVTANVTTVDEIKAMVQANPVDVVYALYTPIETPLSETEIAAYRALHTNYPNTTVLNDSGAHMVVKYAADTKLYIDNKITAMIGG